MCRSCGGGGARNVTPKVMTAVTPVDKQSMVAIEYIGEAPNAQRIRSRAVPSVRYQFSSNDRRFFAYEPDVPWLLSMETQFKRAEQPQPVTTPEAPVLVAQRTPDAPKTNLPIDALAIDPITMALLKREYRTVDDVRRAGYNSWLLIKGIGASRADAIKEALNALEK